MTSRHRENLKELAHSFGIALGFAFLFSLFLARQFREVSQTAFTLCYGLPFGAVFYFVGPRVHRLRTRSFLVTGIVRSSAFALAIAFAFIVSNWILLGVAFHLSPWSREVLVTLGKIVGSLLLWESAAVSLGLVWAVSTLHQISRKLGPGVLWNWLRGYYHVPREEERIFMFLDMKGSTGLAEKLGNLRFSALVRDFFEDLSHPVLETRGEVSHYIGDEAVLTWKMDRGLDGAPCVRCFYSMRKAIDHRRDHYLRHYGVVPEFKAGAHCGRVVATEVGEIKSEIVYHGDVLNAAARIAGLCASCHADLLLSADLAQKLKMPPGFELLDLGFHELKGKEKPMELYGVLRIDGSETPRNADFAKTQGLSPSSSTMNKP